MEMSVLLPAPPSTFTILSDYNEGLRPVQEVLRVVKSFRGREPHWLWARMSPDSPFFFELCVDCFSEAKLFELLQTLIADDPAIPAVKHTKGKSLLSVALERNQYSTVSSRVLLLLAVRGATRGHWDGSNHPLHRACESRRVDPDVINRLVDLDPDDYVLRDNQSRVPLHYALDRDPTARYVHKMVEVRPDTLLCRDKNGQTPVEFLLERSPDGITSEAAAFAVREMVALRPESVVPIERTTFPAGLLGDTALMSACKRSHANPDLVDGILRAYPPALCIATGHIFHRFALQLPLQALTWSLGLVVPPDFAKETTSMVLAVVEYVVGAAALVGNDNATWFQRHVKETVADILPGAEMAGFSGFAVAKAIGKAGSPPDVCRALFCHEKASPLFRNSASFRVAVMGQTTLGLYEMNRRGRFDDNLTADQHVDLLELVNDNVECIYLHVRDNWIHLLVSGGDSSGKGVAGSCASRPTKRRMIVDGSAGVEGDKSDKVARLGDAPASAAASQE
jgi:hypothetical protein